MQRYTITDYWAKDDVSPRDRQFTVTEELYNKLALLKIKKVEPSLIFYNQTHEWCMALDDTETKRCMHFVHYKTADHVDRLSQVVRMYEEESGNLLPQ